MLNSTWQAIQSSRDYYNRVIVINIQEKEKRLIAQKNSHMQRPVISDNSFIICEQEQALLRAMGT